MVECPNCKSELYKWGHGHIYECLICGNCYDEERLDVLRGIRSIE